ncbi:hypothetical protein [Chryseobacterium sp. Leaf201]|uniref:hypothetical protein n=1 Tax=Chryseobacterium sp. Leaf201 TaxID=1735672 RepID=UPI0006F500B8|nr:hypothetical protein [Chryseobacterium sp. Leaf201]KQM41663.1 hypothetical protein ASE55_03345 [Chryseobacterium sp. Leaf201]
MMKLNAKPVNFKMGEYISNGYNFLKSNFGDIFVAFLLCFVMSIIPFCGLLAIGNFYRYCRGLRRGEKVSSGDIFNFDNFMPYFIMQLILIGGLLLIYIPMIIFIPIMANGDNLSAGFGILYMVYMLFVYVAIIVVLIKAFYMTALISLGGITDVKTAWNMSVTMGKGNGLNMFLFILVVAILGYLGILACGIGLLLTIPFVYTAQYFALEDGMQQIEYDEIKEIGSKNEF